VSCCGHLPAASVLFFVCWRGGRNHHHTNRHREHTTGGAATNDHGNSPNASNRFPQFPAAGARETLGSAVACVPGVGVQRQPSVRAVEKWRHFSRCWPAPPAPPALRSPLARTR
jgi:hypothetical protein